MVIDSESSLLLLAVGLAILYLWLKWLQLNTEASASGHEERRRVVEELVQAAEQLYQSQTGQDRLNYVMTALSERYPRLPVRLLRQMLEAAVWRMKNSGAVVTLTEVAVAPPSDSDSSEDAAARWN